MKRLSNRLRPAMLGLCTSALALTATAQTERTVAHCPTASITYGQNAFCSDEGKVMVMLNGTPGGTFTSSGGLQLDAMSGMINTVNSTAGTYTVNYNIPAANGCPVVNTQTSFTIMMRPMVDPVPNPAVCAGSMVNIPAFTGSMPGMTYTWTNDNNSIGLGMSGSGNIAPFMAMNATDEVQVARITVTGSYTDNGVTCTSKPMSFTIFVNPVPEVDDVANISVCNGATVGTIAFTGSTMGSGVRYMWTNDNSMIGLNGGGTDEIASFTAMNMGNTPMVANITVTPYYINGARCAGTPETFTITVNPNPVGSATISYDASPYCSNAGIILPTFTGTTGGTFSASPGGLTINSSNGAVNTGSSTPGTYMVTYTRSTGAGCAEVNTTMITINANTVSLSYAGEPFCTGNNMVSPTIMGAMGGTFTAPAGLTIDANTGMINLATSTGGIYNVNYTVNSGACGMIMGTTQVRVIGTPTITNNLRNQTRCAGQTSFPINFIADDPGTSFTWTNDNINIGLPGTGNGDIAPFMLMNNTGAPIRARIAVTPRLSKYGKTCFGKTRVFYITVNPTPTVTQLPNQPVCVGQMTAPINFTSDVMSNVTYTWTNNNPGIGLPASGTGPIPAFMPTGTGTAAIVVTATYNGSTTCAGAPMGFAIQASNCGPVANPGDNTNGSTDAARTRTPQQVFESQVSTAPNPVSSVLKVNYTGTEGPLTLRLVDMYGQPLKVNRSFGTTGTIDMSALRPGNYVLQLIDERRKLTVQRNIIKL
ncbi:T9SS type A sorting domain-containing protein [Flaviaesturariibacter amylovorans]|uniref:T9SS type A sorting domain-containing protein n=1 Tax=Flaviaesturariibacter amylovorans TaxID=1084520 RepID=A0ABP8GW16_9BACT